MKTNRPHPTPPQVAHHAREFYGFLHFTTNTFTDKEWGYGHDSPTVFNPTEFDADQLIDSAKLAGMRGLILTCRHHDGFCQWPSKFTEHSVRNSPFRKATVKWCAKWNRPADAQDCNLAFIFPPGIAITRRMAARNTSLISAHNCVNYSRNLVDLYFAPVGRGTNFLLNLPPDRMGLIPEVDRQSLRGFRSHLDKTFSHNFAAGHSRSIDWQTIDGQSQWVIEINLPEAHHVNVIELREDIRLGHRVDQWGLEACDAANNWQELATVQSVGARRLVRFASQSATEFRVRITEASDEPLITEAGLYFEPDLTEHRAQTPNEIAARITHKTGDEIVLDLQETMPLLAVRYTPEIVHRVSKYEIAFADVAGQWRDPIAGEFGNEQFNAAPQLVACNTRARYVRFHAKQFCMGDALAGNEMNVLRV
jgi:hypothetical protein